MKKYITILVLTIMILGCSRNYNAEVLVEGKLPVIGKMMFLDSLTGYAIGYYNIRSNILDYCNYDPTNINNQKIGHLIITTDGGKTIFKEIQTPLYTVASFSFINKDCGWICGMTLDDDVTLPNKDRCGFGIYRTTDGGVNWEFQSDYYPHDIFFIDNNIGFAVGRGSRIMKTVDGGLNWKQQKVKENDNNVGCKLATLNKVKFYDKTTGMICGDDNTLLFTEDGGETWLQIYDRKNNLLGNDIGDFAFVQKDNIWAISETGGLRHYNGSSWENLNAWQVRESIGIKGICGSRGNVHCVEFSDKKRGWITCGHGGVFFTNNGGKNWKPIPIKFNKNVANYCNDDVAKEMNYHRLSVLKDNSCFIIGSTDLTNTRGSLIRIK